MRFKSRDKTKQRKAKLQLKDELETNKMKENERKKERESRTFETREQQTFISLQRTDIEVAVIVFIISSKVIARRVVDQT